MYIYILYIYVHCTTYNATYNVRDYIYNCKFIQLIYYLPDKVYHGRACSA